MFTNKIANTLLLLLLNTGVMQASTFTDELSLENKDILLKSSLKIKKNPFAQKILSDIVNDTISKSNNKISNIINKKMVDMKDDLRDEYMLQTKLLSQSFQTELKKIQENNSQYISQLKKTLKKEIKKELQHVSIIQAELEKEKYYYKAKIKELNNKFSGMERKLVKYISLIDYRLSLKQVKETELGKLLLINDFFPIKYIKNIDDKQRIAIILNNNNEYRINSLITDDCRIIDLTRTNIKVECIDIKDKAFTNILGLRVTNPENDYILNATIKILRNTNMNYSETIRKVIGENHSDYKDFSTATSIEK